MDFGLIQAKNIFFVGITTAIGWYAGMIGSAMAQPANKALHAPVYHVGKTAAQTHNAAAVHTESLHKTANRSYQVANQRYYPLQKVAHFTQEGRASWYAPQFHGRKTSSGERYDKNIMTAAHPTLPIPSYARVTNLTNGKSVVVRINDRGPFHRSRVMDVSQAAARELGFIHHGTARVRIEQVVPGMDMKQASRSGNSGNIYVDLQQFDNIQTAKAYLAETSRHLQQAGTGEKAQMVKVKNSYVVRLGPFQQQERADSIRKSLLTAL